MFDGPESCVQCQKGFILYEGKWLTQCPNNTILDPYGNCKVIKSLDGIKFLCEPCLEKDNATNTCKVCGYGYYRYNGTCLQKCPDGYLSYSKRDCVRCESPCKSCETDNVCSQCSGYQFLDFSSNCVVACPRGSYADTNSGRCTKCLPECAACDTGDKCTNCANTLVMANSSCVPCSIANCMTCGYKTKLVCYECAPNYMVSDGGCLRIPCKNNQFVDPITSECRDCTEPCLICSGPGAVSYTHLTLPTIYSV
eukprot:TRINITY_DN8817_c0_g1_i1.p1 TRINITY_DN8817_c0_g1~~TRINITY_DN8817_c0_g1_i1.p1  ORF type:complete len:253 (+),score=-26.54 TRINITY_DN8817_c0_g1_i1:354-1112(+)